MDNKDLANLIFPDVKDYTYYEEKYKNGVKRSYCYNNDCRVLLLYVAS